MRFVPLIAIATMAAVVPTMSAYAVAISTATYLKKAGAGDLYEIESSKLVMATTRNAAIRDFANKMISDHTKSTADVKAAAASARVKVAPPVLEPAQAAMIAQLRKTSGLARDQLYVSQQKKSHLMALNLQQSYSASGTVAALKAVAANIVPVVQMHIEMLKGM